MEEWDVEALPEEKDATGEAAIFAADPAMLLERQRVKEARLKAKLAAYRAQYEMSRFYDKYGNEVSDSEDEEEDEDEEDEGDDEDLFL
jgi:phosphopantothenoylcysteine synthetase/decarboxylase